MKGLLLSILAVFAGAFVAVTLVAVGEPIGHIVFPPPEGLKIDLNDSESLKDVMEKISLGAKVAVVVAWSIASFVGSWFATWLAARLSRVSVGHGYAVGIILVLATLSTLKMIPHPLWMWVAGPTLVAAGSYLGATLAMKGRLRRPAAV